MADTIPGQQVINVGLPNESAGSDSLYTAFQKTKTNFATLFTNASPYNTFLTGAGISVASNAASRVVTITNTGVTNIVAGTNIVIDQSNGNVTISAASGGEGSGTVTSVGVTTAASSRLTAIGGPIVSSGNIVLDLATTGVTPGQYTYPTLTVDDYGRVTSIASAPSVGTVTSVGITPGAGIQVTGSPITSSGSINVINTGVTRLNAGAGILLSGANGNVTVSASLTGGTVTSVGVSSSTLTISGSPVTTTGTISINLPNALSLSGNVQAGNFISGGIISTTGNATVGNLSTAGLITATGNINGGNINTAGSILSSGTSGIGYAVGAGSTVTQGISRTTTVNINASTGSITLFSAAGNSNYTTFTVTNNKVAATDIVIINQKSGTDKYQAFVSNVSAGSFAVTFTDVSGTTTEQPVFNFAIIKGVAS